MSNHTAPTVRRGSSMPISLPTLVNDLAVVAEEQVRRIAQADEEIEIAVVVDVDERRLPRLAGRVDPHRLGDVHERLAGALRLR